MVVEHAIFSDNEHTSANLQQVIEVVERIDQIAANTPTTTLVVSILELLVEIAGASAASLLVRDALTAEISTYCCFGPVPTALVSEALQDILTTHHPMRILNVQHAEAEGVPDALVLTLPGKDIPPGAVVLWGSATLPRMLIDLIVRRLTLELDRVQRITLSERRDQRLRIMIEVRERIGSTLDREQILDFIIDYARRLLNVEAASLFLVDVDNGDIVLRNASGSNTPHLGHVRIPAGKGIIGHVVDTGETVFIRDAKSDPRHFSGVDQDSGFRTRSILAVPLRARMIALGSERGVTPARIIGGLEAINKIDGAFDAEDARLLEMLATEAATVLEIATLYADANELFLDVVHSLTAAIDAKDPYTEGHSKRVSDYAVAIARELDLDAEFVHHVRIGAILHDVGKIGVPDHVLKNTSSLTAEEYDLIKTHPMVGEKIMGQIRTLRFELPALVEHHERIDGTGYPRGLSGDSISLMGRIVAVADTFDAITSDRPYHTGATVEEAFSRLRHATGTHFDPHCVEALFRATAHGHIRTQKQLAVPQADQTDTPSWFPPDLQLP